MTDFAYNRGSKDLWDGTIALLTDTIKVMLVAAGYVANRDDDVVDAGGANDAVDHEISGTGYVAGWGGSGRKTLASKTITEDDANDRSSFDCADVTWTAIDVATEPSQLLMIKEGGANDTTSRIITHHDFVVVTNGGDVTAQIADLLRLSTV
jgi:hypothetical protein